MPLSAIRDALSAPATVRVVIHYSALQRYNANTIARLQRGLSFWFDASCGDGSRYRELHTYVDCK